MIIYNPFRTHILEFYLFNPKPLTWAEKERNRLRAIKAKWKRRKGRVLLTLITILLIMPLIAAISALSAFLHNEVISFEWGILCGLGGLVLFYSIKDKYFDYI